MYAIVLAVDRICIRRAFIALYCISIFAFSGCGGSGSTSKSTATSTITAANSQAVATSMPSSTAVTSQAQSSATSKTVPVGGVATVNGDLSVAPNFWAGSNSGDVGSNSIVTVDHPDFSKAVQIVVTKPSGEFWNGQVQFPIIQNIAKNDVLLIHVWFKKIATLDESGAGFLTVFLETGGPDYTKYTTLEMTSTGEWQEYFIPIQMSDAATIGNLDLKFGFGAGNKAQTIQIGGVELLNFKTTVSLASLPETELTYGGRDADAAWRAEANARIEQYRKGDFELTILDVNNDPVEDAQIDVRFKKHDYQFGSVIVSHILMGTTADSQTYRDKVLELFNQSGTENDLKWSPWIGDWGQNFSKQTTLDALQWLRDRGFYLRGHVLVWPSRRNLPGFIQEYIPVDNPSDIDPVVEQLVLDHIDDIGAATNNNVDEWDVLNEPYDNHDLMDAFGQSVMVDWFAQARENLPTQKLYINDYSILSAGGRDYAHQNSYRNTIQYLVDNNASIDGIGMQSHFSASPTDINTIYNILESFHHQFPELDIRSTEFDVNTKDQILQADFTRDFLTIFFSHPATVGVQMWGFWEGAHWLPDAVLYTQDWAEKPNAKAWKDTIYKTWWNDFSGISDSEGLFGKRGFYGTYDVDITVNGMKQTFQFHVEKNKTNKFNFNISGVN
jgi:endo-1,4-beta-xylanase